MATTVALAGRLAANAIKWLWFNAILGGGVQEFGAGANPARAEARKYIP
jgi:hypothetical protein